MSGFGWVTPPVIGEGDTLVVDTTNFTAKQQFSRLWREPAPDRKVHTRGSDQFLYEYTIDDPESFTKPWTVQVHSTRTEGPLLEYACQEGNYAMEGMLAGARKEEKK